MLRTMSFRYCTIPYLKLKAEAEGVVKVIFKLSQHRLGN